jgi:ABC-type nitrate/sulfonate/bicarbonate transport system permease component
MQKMHKLLRRVLIAFGPLTVLALWYILPKLGLVQEFFLPNPFRVAKETIALLRQGDILPDILYTLLRTSLGFILAASWGIPLGLLVGYYKWLYKMFEVVIDFFRSLPATALIPLALVIFASGETARVFVVLFSCGLVLIINSAYGVRSVNRTRLELAELMKASTLQKFTTVIFREALPEIFAGLRISLSLSLVLVVVSEMFIGTKVGLGKKLQEAQTFNHIAEMYGLILITGVVGYIMNKGFLLFEKYLIHWEGK